MFDEQCLLNTVHNVDTVDSTVLSQQDAETHASFGTASKLGQNAKSAFLLSFQTNCLVKVAIFHLKTLLSRF